MAYKMKGFSYPGKSPAKHFVDDVREHNDGHPDRLRSLEEHEEYKKTPAKQKVDKTMEEEAAREDKKMKEIAIKRGYMLEMVENPDGTRKTIKVPVDKNGNKIKNKNDE
tara:strand:+ start:26 stop:352 length:327 start_codon:yes stop_codon:yes gene_type:complete